MRYFAYLNAIRRRKSHIRAAMLVLCCAVIAGSVYSLLRQREVYQEAISSFALSQVEEFLGRKVEISKFEISPLGPVQLTGVKIEDRQSSLVFNAGSVTINHWLWSDEALEIGVIDGSLTFGEKIIARNLYGNVLLEEGKLTFSPLVGDLLRWEGVSIEGPPDDLYLKAQDFSGRLAWTGDEVSLHRFKIKDYIVLSGKLDIKQKKFLFLVHLDDKNRHPRLTQIMWEGAGVGLERGGTNQALIFGDLSNLPVFKIETRANHLKLGEADILTDITIKGKIIEEDKLRCVLFTTGSIYNQRPFDEVEAEFIISANMLDILWLRLGERFELNGKIALGPGYPVHLVLTTHELDIKELIQLVGFEPEDAASGILNSEFKFRGPIKNPRLRGHLEAREGHLGKVKYKTLKLNLSGRLPVIHFYDSRIWREEGYLELKGELDLRNINEKDFFENMQISSDNKTIIWQGWDISHKTDIAIDAESALSLGKDIGEDFRINFNTYINDELNFEPGNKESIELEYQLDETKSLKMELRQHDEFLSVERKMKF